MKACTRSRWSKTCRRNRRHTRTRSACTCESCRKPCGRTCAHSHSHHRDVQPHMRAHNSCACKWAVVVLFILPKGRLLVFLIVLWFVLVGLSVGDVLLVVAIAVVLVVVIVFLILVVVLISILLILVVVVVFIVV